MKRNGRIFFKKEKSMRLYGGSKSCSRSKRTAVHIRSIEQTFHAEPNWKMCCRMYEAGLAALMA
ncbi:hypothetical protein D3C85_1767000 [compost metagenome]